MVTARWAHLTTAVWFMIMTAPMDPLTMTVDLTVTAWDLHTIAAMITAWGHHTTAVDLTAMGAAWGHHTTVVDLTAMGAAWGHLMVSTTDGTNRVTGTTYREHCSQLIITLV